MLCAVTDWMVSTQQWEEGLAYVRTRRGPNETHTSLPLLQSLLEYECTDEMMIAADRT